MAVGPCSSVWLPDSSRRSKTNIIIILSIVLIIIIKSIIILMVIIIVIIIIIIINIIMISIIITSCVHMEFWGGMGLDQRFFEMVLFKEFSTWPWLFIW